MTQAGILGNLRYDHKVHSWALDIGAALAQYEILENRFTDVEVEGITTKRRELVQTINRLFQSHNISFQVPQIIAEEEDCTPRIFESIFEKFKSTANEANLAFLLIGNANFFLNLSQGSDDKSKIEKMREIASNRIQNIKFQCKGITLDTGALFKIISPQPHDPISLLYKLERLQDKIKILFITADPRNEVRLRLLEERRTLDTVLQSSNYREMFAVDDLPSCRLQDLSHGLLRFRPTIIHFSGHGSPNGLCFEADDGTSKLVDPASLGRLLSLARKNGLQGVLMNACSSESQVESIAGAVEHVIAMESVIGDREAISFTREFYGALGAGETFDSAFEWAHAGSGLDPDTSALKPHLHKK